MALKGTAPVTTAALAATFAPLLGTETILFRIRNANMNITTDQIMTKIGTFTNYIPRYFLAYNASISLTTAAGGIYTAAAKGGTAMVAAGQVYSGLTNASQVLQLTLANSDQRAQIPILSLTTAQGAASTMDLILVGIALT